MHMKLRNQKAFWCTPLQYNKNPVKINVKLLGYNKGKYWRIWNPFVNMSILHCVRRVIYIQEIKFISTKPPTNNAFSVNQICSPLRRAEVIESLHVAPYIILHKTHTPTHPEHNNYANRRRFTHVL